MRGGVRHEPVEPLEPLLPPDVELLELPDDDEEPEEELDALELPPDEELAELEALLPPLDEEELALLDVELELLLPELEELLEELDELEVVEEVLLVVDELLELVLEVLVAPVVVEPELEELLPPEVQACASNATAIIERTRLNRIGPPWRGANKILHSTRRTARCVSRSA